MPLSNLIDAQVLIGLREAAEEVDVDLSDALRRVGLDKALLARPGGYISWFDINDLLELIAQENQCQYFGLLVGKHQESTQFGVLSHITKLCPDVRTAIEKGFHYLPLYSQIAQWTLVEEDGHAVVTRQQRTSGQGHYAQISTLGTIQTLKVIKSLCGTTWRPSSVLFSHAEPDDHAKRAYQKYFNAPVSFNRESNSIIFPATDLMRPIASADAQLLKIVEGHARSLLEEHGAEANLVEQVRSMIRQRLGGAACSINHVAQLLHIHPKALHRQLKAENLTFKQLLNEERHKLAQYYLSNSDIRLVELAEIVGYSDASALSRAFKTQCGLSPNEWKMQHEIASSG